MDLTTTKCLWGLVRRSEKPIMLREGGAPLCEGPNKTQNEDLQSGTAFGGL